MKVFISWSGDRSKHIATALHGWLPTVIQVLEPFISSQNIGKGERGGEVIADNLENSKFGIVCLTPENLSAPWILFESGALSKIVTSPVCTYLYEITSTDIKQPLGQFQHTVANKEDTLALIQSINSKIEKPLLPDVLKSVFDRMWDVLAEKLQSVPKIDASDRPSPRTTEDKIDELLAITRSIYNDLTDREETAIRSLSAGAFRSDSMRSVTGRRRVKADGAFITREQVDFLRLLDEHESLETESHSPPDFVTRLLDLGFLRNEHGDKGLIFSITPNGKEFVNSLNT